MGINGEILPVLVLGNVQRMGEALITSLKEVIVLNETYLSRDEVVEEITEK